MELLKSKRGEETKLYFLIWEGIALLMVVIIILVAIKGIAGNSSYWKKYYSADTAFIAELENTNQGDFTINYALKETPKVLTSSGIINEKKYTLVLKNDHTEIYLSPKEKDNYPAFWPFAKSENTLVKESESSSKFIIISKTGSQMSLGSYYYSADSCPTIDTSADISKIKFNILSADQTMTNQASTANAVLGIYGKDTVQNSSMTIIIKESETIGIHYPTDTNILRSEKIACIISNKMTDALSASLAPNSYQNYTSITTDIINNSDTFEQSISAKYVKNYIIITMPERLVEPKTFAKILQDSFIEYYK